MQIAFVISLVFAILISIFAVMNSDTVTIRLLWKQFEFSQAIVILGSATIGALILFIIGSVKDIKKNLKIRELNKKIKDLESRLSSYESTDNIEEHKELIDKEIDKVLKIEKNKTDLDKEEVVNSKIDDNDKPMDTL